MLSNLFKKDEPVKITFLFHNQSENRKRLTWDDLDVLEGLQDGSATSKGIKNLAARFMSDGNGKYIDHDKAVKILGSLSADDIQDVMKQFTEAIQDSAVSPTNGNPSKPPSEAGQAMDSQAGLQP